VDVTEIVCSSPHGPVVFRAEDWYAVHGTDLLHRRRWVGTGTDLEVSFMTFPGDDPGHRPPPRARRAGTIGSLTACRRALPRVARAA
jgi:hypothetical protein